MAGTWTTDQVASLAPDAASLKAAQGLASARKWSLLGSDNNFIWGLAQGSGKEPYQSQIDLREPAFKCSCPSRKFPCKHGLGLLLLFAAQPGAITVAARPAWVAEWAEKRDGKLAQQEAKAAEAPSGAEKTPDPEAQAKRREKRGRNIDEGLRFLEGWLHDLLRQGLASKAGAGYGFWDAAARRLVDAQAPGLARRVRELGALVPSLADCDGRVIAALGRLHVLVSAASRREHLSEAWQQEIDSQLGWSVSQDELREAAGIQGSWFVGAQTQVEEERLVLRTSFLFSPTGASARILEFFPVGRPSVATVPFGRWLAGELVFYPGVATQRAVWKTAPMDTPAAKLELLETCEQVLASHAGRLALNPLAEPSALPVRLTPALHEGRWWLRDDAGHGLPLSSGFQRGWELFSCSGGRPLALVVLWDGFEAHPLSVLLHSGAAQLSTAIQAAA